MTRAPTIKAATCAAALTAIFTMAATGEESPHNDVFDFKSIGSNYKLPVCKSASGQNVKFIYAKEPLLEGFSLAYSFNQLDNNYEPYPVTVFDDEFLALSDAEKEFIIQHECAHHWLDHPRTIPELYFLTPPQSRDDQMRRLELHADCLAARAVKKSHGGKLGPMDLYKSMKILVWTGESETHPDGMARYKNAKNCIR